MKYLFKKFQAGYLLISALVLIVIVALLATTVSYLVVTETISATYQLESARALYIARAGLERAIYVLLDPNIGVSRVYNCGRIGSAIPGIPGNPFYQMLFGGGRFTASADEYTAVNYSILSVGINATTHAIPVNDISFYPDHGRVMIDRETISYKGKTNTSSICEGNPPCLHSAIRGAANTTAVSHAAGTPVSQSQCEIFLDASVPDFNNPVSQNHISAIVPQLEDGWTIGNLMLGRPYLSFARWDGLFWTLSTSASPALVNLHGLSVLSYADAWAVGDAANLHGYAVHWSGGGIHGGWHLNNGNIPNKNLYAVDCAKRNDCWAGGQDGTLVHWAGGPNWTPVMSLNHTIRAISCNDIGNCLFVGDNGLVARANWNASHSASTASSGTSSNILGVSCPRNGGDCFTVGQTAGSNNAFRRCNIASGSPCSSVTTSAVPSINYQDVVCLATNNCWAVGSNRILHYNGSTWSQSADSPMTTLPGNLYSVDCVADNNCWAVGHARSFAHYNGSSWTRWYAPSGPLIGVIDDMNAIRMVRIKNPSVIPWREAF